MAETLKLVFILNNAKQTIEAKKKLYCNISQLLDN